MPAGRIGKQVQDLRGTAAVMAEFRSSYATVPCMGRQDRNADARAGRPALLFESLPVPPGGTAVGTGRGPRGGRTKRLRGKTMVHRVLACFVFVRAFFAFLAERVRFFLRWIVGSGLERGLV